MEKKIFKTEFCKFCDKETRHENYFVPDSLNRCLNCLRSKEQIEISFTPAAERWKGYGEEIYVPGDPNF